MELHTNSSNNTIYADADGNIAYFHANFIPQRDPKFDWTKPVDGSDPATEWQGLLSVDETPKLLNPPSGWLYNSNNWPWSAAGPEQPEEGGLSRPTWRAAARTRAASTRFGCSTTGRTSRSTGSSRPPTTATCRRSRADCPRCSRRGTACRRATR